VSARRTESGSLSDRGCPSWIVHCSFADDGECFLLPLGPVETLPELLRGEQDVRWIYGAGCRTWITA